MVPLHDRPSRVRLGALDGVAAADCIEDLEDRILCQLEDLLHIHSFQRNNSSWSRIIPISKEGIDYGTFLLLEDFSISVE